MIVTRTIQLCTDYTYLGTKTENIFLPIQPKVFMWQQYLTIMPAYE